MTTITTHPRITFLRATAARYGLEVHAHQPYLSNGTEVILTTGDEEAQREVYRAFSANLDHDDALSEVADFLAELAAADDDAERAEIILEHVHARQDEEAAYYARQFAGATAARLFYYDPEERPYEGRSAYKNEAVSA